MTPKEKREAAVALIWHAVAATTALVVLALIVVSCTRAPEAVRVCGEGNVASQAHNSGGALTSGGDDYTCREDE